mmetsp:Transcript_56256/g.89294  ORF Transcript_56256/g.89294 Transcript_56256/m.89294 type:complete len:750 (-) Transcript_56256:538-2787(-)
MEVGPALETDLRKAGLVAMRQFLANGEILSFPRRPNGSPMLLRQGFFERLLKKEVDFASCLDSDLVAAQADIRHLSLPQLLHIRCENIESQVSARAQAQSKFLACIDESIEQCVMQKLSCTPNIVPQMDKSKASDLVHLALLIYGVYGDQILNKEDQNQSGTWLVRLDSFVAVLQLSTCELLPLECAESPSYWHQNLSRSTSAVSKDKKRLHWKVELSCDLGSVPVAPRQTRRRKTSDITPDSSPSNAEAKQLSSAEEESAKTATDSSTEREKKEETASKTDAELVAVEAASNSDAERLAIGEGLKVEGERIEMKRCGEAEAEMLETEKTQALNADRLAAELAAEIEAECAAAEITAQVDDERLAAEESSKADIEQLELGRVAKVESEHLAVVASSVEVEQQADPEASEANTKQFELEGATKSEDLRFEVEWIEKLQSDPPVAELDREAEAELLAAEVVARVGAERLAGDEVSGVAIEQLKFKANVKGMSDQTEMARVESVDAVLAATDIAAQAEVDRVAAEEITNFGVERIETKRASKAESDQLAFEATEATILQTDSICEASSSFDAGQSPETSLQGTSNTGQSDSARDASLADSSEACYSGVTSTTCSSPRSDSLPHNDEAYGGGLVNPTYVADLERELQQLRAKLAVSEEARQSLEGQLRTSVAHACLPDVVQPDACLSTFDISCGDSPQTNNDLRQIFECGGTVRLSNCSKESKQLARGRTKESRGLLKKIKSSFSTRKGGSQK